MLKAILPRRRRTELSGVSRPARWLVDAWSGGPTASGIEVNEKTALNYAAVYCAVSVITGALKQLPLPVYRRVDERTKVKARQHPVFKLLNRRPNPEQSPAQFKTYMQACALLWESAYAVIKTEPLAPNRPIALVPIHPSEMVPVRKPNGTLGFEHRHPTTGQTHLYDDSEVIRIYGPSRDGVTAYSILTAARECFGLGLATEMHGSTFFGNSARPGGVVLYDKELGETAYRKLKKAWNKVYGGPAKSNKTAILEYGMQYQQVGLPNEVSQFLETRHFQIEDVARWFNVPPHKLKHLLYATFSNITEQSLEFVGDTMMPWIVTWEEELNLKLFTEAEQDEYFVKFEVNGILRSDPKARGEYYAMMHRISGLTTNDILDFEDMNPIGPEGDRRFVEMNLIPRDQLPPVGSKPPEKPKPKNEGLSRAARRLLRDAYGRIVSREVERIRRAAKRLQPDISAFVAWLDEFGEGTHAEYVRMVLSPVLDAIGDMYDLQPDVETSLACYRVNSSGLRDLASLRADASSMSDVALAFADVEGVLEDWERSRADKLTVTELETLGIGADG